MGGGRRRVLVVCVGLVGACSGCNAILNGWLDPTIVGNFRQDTTQDIRAALTVESSPWGIPGASEPTRDDLVPSARAYPISAGDLLAVVIEELTAAFAPWQAQLRVDEIGDINIPKIGRVRATGLTPRQLEDKIKELLSDPQYDVLKDPEVMVSGLALHEATYSIFGIGVSASTNAPLLAGTFPIRRPDLRILEAINEVGGLNEFVTEVYVFRQRPADRQTPEPQGRSGVLDEDQASEPVDETKPEPDAGAAEIEVSSPEEEIRDLVLEAEPPVHVTLRSEQEEPKPELPPKYIWIDDEFVPNPELEEDAAADESAVAHIPTFEAMQSTVDWARIAGERDYRIIRIPAQALRNGDRDFNIVVRSQDVIRIVSGEIGVYYVMGQVVRPGPYAFNAEQITLKSAIAAAGNLSALAWPSNCTVYRRTGLREQMIQVDLDAIFAGKTSDFVILRGDIINVGTSPLAPFLARLRSLTLPNPVSNIGYSFTYSRNFADIDAFSSQINPANKPDKFPGLFP